MKKLTAVLVAALLAGCSGFQTKESTQVAFVQACTSYTIALTAAVQARQLGKLSQAQIDQITLLDSQITPLCSGQLPSDPQVATAQVTSAVTTLMVLEAIKEATK